MKNKDIVFIIAVKKDGQLKPEYEIGIESWRRWCKKNDVELFLLEEPVLPMEDMHIIWQRYFLFDIYDANEIEANQTLMVDADTIIHPDCPNFFNETDNKYCMIHDDGSYDWVLRGMEHYSKYVYDGAWFNYWEYGNSGFQIVNDKHRDFFQHMRDFYFENIENINMIQQKWGTGTDQTPLNFNLNLQNVDVKLLPYKYNMGCMIKKEILDPDMLFTKIGWIYHFNGIPDKDTQVPLWMKKHLIICMVKVHLIGYGKWGAVIDNAINDLNVKHVEPKDADWIIISTPNDLHYEQVSYWLGQRKNVFCEKPLTLNYKAAKELFDFADTMGVKLYVDDVFTWRDDYDIYDDVNHFVWTKPKQKDINYIDRLAYHHFYMWVLDTDFEIRDITGEPNDFKIELEDGRTAEFFYGYSSQVVHFVNNEDMTNNQNNPLRTMFEFLFSGSGNYELNRKLTLNATKLSEQVKKTLWPKALVVGGGIFGTTSAVALANNGYQVELHEELEDVMMAASDINQYRLHKGYHYPRSKETAQECLKGLYTFKRKYERSVVNGDIEHYYAIASEDSKVSEFEYLAFLDDLELPYERVKPLPNTDVTIKVEEELFDSYKLYESVRDKLWSSGVEVLKNKTTTKDDFKGFDVVVIATYAKLNELLDEKKWYQYELCEKPVVRLPKKYQGKSIVIMDGPFMCLDPYGDRNHVLGNVKHAIHTWNEGTEAFWPHEYTEYLNKGVIENPKHTKIDKFIETGKKFFKDFDKLKHIGSMYTIRTVLANRDHDDARPTLVNHEGGNVYSLFSGKIDTCVDSANELIRLLNGKD